MQGKYWGFKFILIRETTLAHQHKCHLLQAHSLQLSPSPSLQPSISPEDGDFDSDTYLQSFDASEVLVNNRTFFIYNFGRDAADDEAAEDEASEDEADGATVNYDILSLPDWHYDNHELGL